MKKSLISAALLIVVAIAAYLGFKKSSEGISEDSTRRVAEPAESVTYRCANDRSIYAGFSDGIIALALSDGREFTLEQTLSGDESRYANEGDTIVFWTRGRSAFLEEGGVETFSACVTSDGAELEFLRERSAQVFSYS